MIQMMTLIYPVESFNSRVECLFVFFFFALPLTVCVAFVAALRASNYLPLQMLGREINPAKCASAAMKATQCCHQLFFISKILNQNNICLYLLCQRR